jgi:hypothetical protein
MKFTTSVFSVLLVVAPVLISAAPTTSGSENKLAERCNANLNDRQRQAMAQATSDAHKSQDACPEARKKEFDNDKNKQSRELKKTNCVVNWTRYVNSTMKIYVLSADNVPKSCKEARRRQRRLQARRRYYRLGS